jgi:hypothetical protein
MKPIRFSPHAESNFLAREIERSDAEDAIRNPDRRELGRFPREIATKEYFDKATGSLMLLRVVFRILRIASVIFFLSYTSPR